MNTGPEFTQVESPFLDQLNTLGWRVFTGGSEHPTSTGRDSFREVLLKGDLRKALTRINQRDGEPWLDAPRLSQAVGALKHFGARRLMEANQEATALLQDGITVEGLADWDQGRARTIHYIDWDHPENNTFTAINQFRVECPRGQTAKNIYPDIVLFINGIPVVVIECKAPDTGDVGISEAVDQLRRYHNQRRRDGEVELDEGSERLFHTNQILIATRGQEARVGTIGADLEHYMEWKDTAPVPLDDVRAETGSQQLSSQQRLIAGLLRPAHLLDVLRHCTLFQPSDTGKTLKIVARYQQFRAVQYTIDRLLHGKTRKQDGESDRRGGIIWHTQGSGKSLTMVFLVRKMRSMPELRRFKVVVVTDRKDLQRQLSRTAELTGENVAVVKKVKDVSGFLKVKGPGLVFVMIQKYGGKKDLQSLGRLNDDETIAVLVDEAHRSHGNTFHAHLQEALPNAARIGFTGTPILMGDKKRTHSIFGEFIDRYTLRESEADKATVPILYEGRTADAAVADGRDLDQLFEDMFDEKTLEELERIQRKYGTKGSIFEAEKVIQAKAHDMLRHYVENILPSGLKAQVVAFSRRAAVRYQEAFIFAQDELIQQARALDKPTRELQDEALQKKPAKIRSTVHAWRHLADLERLQFAAVISADHNDPAEWSAWSNSTEIKQRTDDWFKRPLRHADPSKSHGLAFLIVKSMLLTGFDAPIEGVMYLDRPIKEAELLQAIARVNRTGHGKEYGIVVDYYGVARHLKEALAAYSDEDIEGVLQSLADEIPKLRDRHRRARDVFTSRGLELTSHEECALLLADEKIRAEFTVKLKQFLVTLDLVLPRPEALPFMADAAALGAIYNEARRNLKILPPLAKSVGRKVQRLIDEHLVSLGIDPKIPPVYLTDDNFEAELDRHVSDRAKASEMEHALRHHVSKKLDQDPVYYGKLSERLEEILKRCEGDWAAQQIEFAELIEKQRERGREIDSNLGLSPIHLPFFDVLKEEVEKERPVVGPDESWLAQQTIELVRYLREQSRVVGFWKNASRQEELSGEVFQFLDSQEIIDFDRAEAVADRVMELAKANRHRLEEEP